MAQPQQTAQFCRTNRSSTTPWFWQILLVTAFIGLGLASEGLACHLVSVSPKPPTPLTYYAVQGANPTNQIITVSKTSTSTDTLTASDDATWLTVLPATTSLTKSAKLITAAVNTSGLTAGTYQATTTIKVGTWCTYKVPVTLNISPSPATSSPPPPTTSTATLMWNAVTGTTVSGYKIYYGLAPQQYTQSINVGNVTSSTVNSLTVGRMYYFSVTAYNSAGDSPRSNEVSKTIQ